MRFGAFAISEHIRYKRQEIVETIHEINPRMVETDPSSSCVLITSCRNVIESYGSPKFMISDKALKEIVEMQLPGFPFTADRRQIASLCLAPIWVSCVGFDQPTVIAMARQVSLLGGIFTRGMSQDVTLVVASTNASPKVFDARKKRIPVVSKGWLDKCIESCCRVPLDSFYLPKFQGLTVSSSDLSPDEHRECKRIVLESGGTWKDIFDSEVTILLADCLANTKKIDMALEYCVPIVRSDLLRQCNAVELLNWWCMSDKKSKLFEGCVFSIHSACKNTEALQLAIQAHSGTIGSNPNYSLVPHGMENPYKNSIAVTSFWFWKCVETNSIIPVECSIMYSPLAYSGPIEQVLGKVFYITDIDPAMRHSLADMIRFAGGTVVYRPTNRINYAIGSNPTKTLVKLSFESNVIVVKSTFVYDMIRTGTIPNPGQHRVDGTANSVLLQKICNRVSAANIKNEESVSVMVERKDLESFTQELTATQDEVTIEVRYESQVDCSVCDTSQDPLLAAMK